MESFALAAEHSGAINHVHTLTIGPSVVGVARELRLAVTVAVVGWVAVAGIRALCDGAIMAEQTIQVEAAEPAPPGLTADLDHPEDALHSIILAIAILTLILPVPFFFLRVYAPWKLSSPLKVDDSFCVAAFLSGISYLSSAIVFAEHGGGHHVWEVTDSQLQAVLETTYWNSIVYSPAALFTKVTLLLITIRTVRGNRPFVYAGYCLITVMVGYYVPVTILKIMTCRPIRGYWDYEVDSNCYDYRLVFLSDAIGAVITNVLVLLMAVSLLWMLWRPRIKMWLILGAGSAAVAMSLVRMGLVISLKETNDPTVDFVKLSLFG
ncbi:hypothetical protein N8I77_010237 [Diaporthe amygdali]|uniref:Rhodopsin domain-containing protein n=1 Tax=Phomopsis amygdali TaxID=1214568 RepID=A0AAD9S6S0_PHOAM|nr:hypothetical protein N8I77_010237 [Diaporthe amygdali]